MTKQTRTRGEDYEAPTPVPRAARTQGRPELWSETWITQAAFMARNGATDVEMAKELGCALSTFYLRMNQYPQFSEAVNAGKAAYDQRVSNSLARRAIGYEHETEKVFSNGLRVKVIEHVPPDTTAQIFWLKNRQPEMWRDRKETEIIVPVTDDVGEVRDAPAQTGTGPASDADKAAHYGLGLALRDLGDLTEAEESLREASADGVVHADSALALAWMTDSISATEAEAIQKAQQSSPDGSHERMILDFTLSKIEHDQGDYEDAARYLRRCRLVCAAGWRLRSWRLSAEIA